MNVFVKRSLKSNLVSRKIHSCFWKFVGIKIYVKFYPRMVLCLCCSAKNDFLFLFCWIRIKNNLPLKRPLIKSLFKSNDDACMFLTTKKSHVSSANYFGLYARLSAKSLLWIKKKKGPRIEPWAPALTHTQAEIWSLRTTRCFLLFKK